MVNIVGEYRLYIYSSAGHTLGDIRYSKTEVSQWMNLAVAGLIKLDAETKAYCNTEQSTGVSQSIWTDSTWTHFDMHLVSPL